MISIEKLAKKSYEEMSEREKDFMFTMSHSEYKEFCNYKSGLKEWFRKTDNIQRPTPLDQ